MGKIISPQVPVATREDYVKIQGGMPDVSEKDGIATIKHNYPEGENMIVKGRVSHQTVVISVEGKGPREFNAEYLKQFHGEPCERQSKSMGGEGYDRGQTPKNFEHGRTR